MKKTLLLLSIFTYVFSSAQSLEKTYVVSDKVLYSLVSYENGKYTCTPYFFSDIKIYTDYYGGAPADYAICTEATDSGPRLSCWNSDLSTRFAYPGIVGKAGPFVNGVSIVNSYKWGLGGPQLWGAVSRDGSIVIPIEHQLVVRRGDRIASFDESESGYCRFI